MLSLSYLTIQISNTYLYANNPYRVPFTAKTPILPFSFIVYIAIS